MSDLRRLRPVRDLGAVASILISATSAMAVVFAAVLWHSNSVVHGYAAGEAGVTDEDLTASDLLVGVASLVFVVLALAAAVVFVVWLWRARRNAEALSPVHHRRRRGWIIGGWVCPIVQLWFPYQIAQDVWRGSREAATADDERLFVVARSRLVLAWWLAWVTAVVLDRVVARTEPESPEAYQSMTNVNIVGTAVTVLAGVLVILVIREISGWQTRRLHAQPPAGPAQQAVVDGPAQPV